MSGDAEVEAITLQIQKALEEAFKGQIGKPLDRNFMVRETLRSFSEMHIEPNDFVDGVDYKTEVIAGKERGCYTFEVTALSKRFAEYMIEKNLVPAPPLWEITIPV